MKHLNSRIHSAALAATPLLCLALSLCAGEQPATPSPKPAKARPAAANVAPAVVEVPKSVFIIPASPAEGKDPFFPKSMRLFTTVVVTTAPTTKQQVSAPVELTLKGISGTAEDPLAIINNRTFAKGEQQDLPTSTGKVPIRCIEIAADSVVVQIGGERRILHLRPGT